ncbi:kh domain protein [Ichthyophthirius multifiliis]|uniref:Kh domain protein n=1 Tax=Ichthyophthirius multifiliis TaxID=5932 RepID=G0QT93_ICHMU|nr:kh domain protein [Ichthyophthirius multifiliis]EGR31566.1 kh domain protein [Ichthyophthirius multifiliis]|eukprot:XP_004035052.1 kh domain protein [Ichthyophthirius multifiliis]
MGRKKYDSRSKSKSRSRSREKKHKKQQQQQQEKKRTKFSDAPIQPLNQQSDKPSGEWNQDKYCFNPNPTLDDQLKTQLKSILDDAQRKHDLGNPHDIEIKSQNLNALVLQQAGIQAQPQPQEDLQSQLGMKTIVRTIDIPTDSSFNYVGLIIGPKGSNQKRIQEKTRCKIIIKNEPPNPNIQIYGLTEKEVAEACCEIERILFSDEATRNKIKSEQLKEVVADHNNNCQGVNPNTAQNKFIVKVPINYVGLVLGKGGETIKQIKNQSQASYILMDSNQNQGEEFKDFTVYGTKEQCELANKLIFDYIEQYKNNTKKDTFEVPVEIVGTFIGKNGCNIININRCSGGAKIVMNNNVLNVQKTHKIFEIIGNDSQIQNAKHLCQNLLDQLTQQQQSTQQQQTPAAYNPQMAMQYQYQQMLMQQQQQMQLQQYYYQLNQPQIEEITLDDKNKQ